MLVALTVTPALSLLLRPRSRAGPAESPPIVARSRATTASVRLGRCRPRRARRRRRAPRGRAGARCRCCDRADSLVPDFKDRDVLIQMTSAPGTSLPAMQPHRGACGPELRAVTGVDNVGGHVGRADPRRPDGRRQLRRALGQHRRRRPTTTRPSRDRGGRRPATRESRRRCSPTRRSASTTCSSTPDGVEGKDLTVRVFG